LLLILTELFLTLSSEITLFNKMSKMSDITYDPSKSHVSDDVLQEFISHADIMSLEKVPGIGPAHAKSLEKCKVKDQLHMNTGYSLVGVYLLLVEPGMTQQSHCDRFCKFLHDHGVKGNIHTICSAVANRCAVIFPGIYDKAHWDTIRGGGHKAKTAASPLGASPVLSGA